MSKFTVSSLRLLPSKPADSNDSTFRAFLVGSGLAIGGVLYGYDTGLISGILAMTHFREKFSTGYRNDHDELDFTGAQSALIVSILSAGTLCGALSASFFADSIGRRWSLVTANAIFVLGVLFQTISTSLPLFIAGRYFAGAGVGLLSPLVPLYQSETAPKWIRGSVVTLYPWVVTMGLFLAAIVNNATKNMNNSGSYRIPIALQFVFSIIIVGVITFLPETPRYLVMKGQPEKALQALVRLRGLDASHESIIRELDEIKLSHEAQKAMKRGSYSACFKGTIGKRLATGCMIQAFSQLCGINFIFYYGTQFFKNSGIDNAFTIQVTTNTVNVVCTIPGLILVDRWGRRNLLLLGAAGMAISQLVVAVVGTVLPGSDVANKILIACVCVFIASFAMSWAPCGWIVTGELFPLQLRAKCLSITTATNWLFNWAIAYSTPYLVDNGPGNAALGSKVFFVWGSCAAIAYALVYLMVYETKGLSLEQVDLLYASVRHAWKSKTVLPTVTASEASSDPELIKHSAALSSKTADENVVSVTQHHERV